MNDKLSALFNRIKADSNLLTVSEAQTSQGIVLPILNNLGWDVFDTSEVTPEYSVSGGRVDFALRIQAVNKVFLEIKKTSENLENHQQQLVYYAFQQGVKLAILTNGITWQFYLPLEEGSWEQRRFFTIDLVEQAMDDAIEKFEVLLSRNNIESGNSYQEAKSFYEGRQKNKIIKENLPKAWQKLISEPDDMLVELVNETLEKLCGYKSEKMQIVDFLKHKSANFDNGKRNTKMQNSPIIQLNSQERKARWTKAETVTFLNITERTIDRWTNKNSEEGRLLALRLGKRGGKGTGFHVSFDEQKVREYKEFIENNS
jgi:predicted type IV restriction endonuclease